MKKYLLCIFILTVNNVFSQIPENPLVKNYSEFIKGTLSKIDATKIKEVSFKCESGSASAVLIYSGIKDSLLQCVFIENDEDNSTRISKLSFKKLGPFYVQVNCKNCFSNLKTETIGEITTHTMTYSEAGSILKKRIVLNKSSASMSTTRMNTLLDSLQIISDSLYTVFKYDSLELNCDGTKLIMVPSKQTIEKRIVLQIKGSEFSGVCMETTNQEYDMCGAPQKSKMVNMKSYKGIFNPEGRIKEVKMLEEENTPKKNPKMTISYSEESTKDLYKHIPLLME